MKDADRTPSPDTPGPSGNAAGARRSPFRPVLFLAVLALLGLLATAAFKSYRDLDMAKRHERQLIDEIAEAQERVHALDRRIDGIRNDPMLLERLAREELGMVNAGDVVIVLPDPRPPTERELGANPRRANPRRTTPRRTTPRREQPRREQPRRATPRRGEPDPGPRAGGAPPP